MATIPGRETMSRILILIVMLFVIASLLTTASALAGNKATGKKWKPTATTIYASWSD